MADNYLSKIGLEVEGVEVNAYIKDASARGLIAQEIADRSALIKTDGGGNTLITTEKKITESAHDKETTIIGANSTHVDGANTVNVGGPHTETYASTCDKTVTGKNTVHYDGANTVNVGGPHTETYVSTYDKTVTGKNTVHYNGGSEEIHKHPAKITAPDLTLDIKNGLTYSKPIVLNEFFNYVNAKSLTGEIYKILTAGTNIADIGTGGGDVTLDMLATVEENLKALIPSFSSANFVDAKLPHSQAVSPYTVVNMGYIDIPANCLYISSAIAECEITGSYSQGAYLELEAGPNATEMTQAKERYASNVYAPGIGSRQYVTLSNLQVYWSESGVRLNYLFRCNVSCTVWPVLQAIVIPFAGSKTLPSISDTLQQYVNARIATINAYLNNSCDSFVGIGDTHQNNNYYSEI